MQSSTKPILRKVKEILSRSVIIVILCWNRNTRFEQYLQNIDHSLDFVNEALTTGAFAAGMFLLWRQGSFSLGSKMALLTSNRVMSKRLDNLLHQNTIWSKTINPFQLAFAPHDPKHTRSALSSLGVLVHSGKKKPTHQNPVVFQGNSFSNLLDGSHLLV